MGARVWVRAPLPMSLLSEGADSKPCLRTHQQDAPMTLNVYS